MTSPFFSRLFESEFETLFIFIASLFISLVVTKGMIKLKVLDHPKERSSHSIPLPTSGGVGIIAGFLTFLIAYHFYVAPVIMQPILWIIGGAIVLGTMGFVDEIIEISFLKRLVIQLIVSAVVITQAFPYIDPLSLKFAVLLILLGGFVNAYNFFDGLNGLAGTSALVISFFAAFLFQGASILYLALAPALMGFLYWNRRGKIIQGDVGTFFTGFCLPSFLLLELRDISDSVLVMGLLFFPMLFDISVTIATRLIRRETVTQPHKGFFFHRLNAKGWSHLKIANLYSLLTIIQGGLLFVFNVEDTFTLGVIYGASILFYSILFGYLMKRPTTP